MGKKVAKFSICVILAFVIALGSVVGLVKVIPIRGTELAMIVMPIGFLIVFSLIGLAGYRIFREEINNELGGKR